MTDLDYRKDLGLRWLYIDCDSYFATIEQQVCHELRNRPMVVVPVDSDYTCAIAASYEAKKFGIKTGTRIKDAKNLCPGLVCVIARHELYVKYHHLIIEEVNKHIPIAMVGSIDEFACKLWSNENTVEDISKLAAKIKTGIRQNVGDYIGCSIGASSNKLIAKLATNLRKPDGLMIIKNQDLPEAIKDIKLSKFAGIGANIYTRLLKAGISDITALYNTTPKQLRNIWGSVDGERFWYLMRGVDLPDKEIKTSMIGHSRVLGPEVRDVKSACSIAKELALKIGIRIRNSEYYAYGFSIKITLINDTKIEKKYPLNGTNDDFSFLALVKEFWKELQDDITIKKVSLASFKLKKLAQKELSLFNENNNANTAKETNDAKLCNLIDGINSKFKKRVINVGIIEQKKSPSSQPKIAFGRIPDKQEFY